MKMVDISGQKFHRWTVIDRAGRAPGQTLWNCVCECGTKRKVASASLRKGISQSCGCYQDERRHDRLIDITGQRFGFLNVIGRGPNSNTGLTRWACRCDCGHVGIYHGDAIKTGHTRSCGCATKGLISEANTTHGHKRISYQSPTYNTWRSVKARCSRKSAPSYNIYGGRGITICKRWAESFEAFLEDMGERPSIKHTLDRIDVQKGYAPDNCRWADWITQANNKTNNALYTHNGVTKTGAQWSRDLGGNPNMVGVRIRRGWSVEAAVTAKAGKS